MRALLVVAPGVDFDPAAWLPAARLGQPRVAPAGAGPEAGLLGLLGQEPAAWTGPAAFYAAAAGVHLVREEETAYLLDLVRVEGDVVVERRPWGRALRDEILGRLAERLSDEPLRVCAGELPVLVLGEPCLGPPQAAAAPLVGARWGALPAGPPALLGDVVAAGRAACAAAGRPDHAVCVHAPAGPGEVTPLREAWLGLGPSAVVGSRAEARALALLLGLTHHPARAGDELAVAAARTADLVVAVCDQAPGAPPDVPVLIAAGAAQRGVCPVAWRGGGAALGAGPHVLWSLLEASDG